MKAFVVTHYGPDGLAAAEVATPTAGPGDVLVDIRAASINPLDKMIRNGEFKQLIKYKPPFALGHDLSGVGRPSRAYPVVILFIQTRQEMGPASALAMGRPASLSASLIWP